MKLLRKKPYDSGLYGTAASIGEEILFLVQTMLIQKGFTVQYAVFLLELYEETDRLHRMLFLLKLTGGRQASQDAVLCSNLPEADRHHRMLSATQTKRRQTSFTGF
jgi:hypothetical protein